MSDSPPSAALNPLAPEHLPFFLPAADGTDTMMHTAIFFLLFFAFVGGVFYLHLHSLPERMAHGHGRTQFQIVAILGLLALFTHENIFWIIGLLLAATTLPDFVTPITSGARSLARLVGRDYEGDEEPEVGAGHTHGHGHGHAHGATAGRQGREHQDDSHVTRQDEPRTDGGKD